MKEVDAVITGMGAVSAAGGNLEETLKTFLCGRRNAGPVLSFHTELSYPVFEVKNLSVNWQRDNMRTVDLAMSAVQEALDEAELWNDLTNFRTGVCLGTTVASQLNDIEFYRSYKQTGKAAMNSVDRFLKGSLAEIVARAVGAQGPYCTVVNACSSSADAIGVALSWLRNGVCEIAIAGGADELNRVPLCGFGSLGIVSDSLCAPFDRDRKGLNLGEGAGVLVLEKMDVIRQRGRKPSLFIAGYGAAGDAYHLTAPRPDGAGLISSLRKSMSEAGIGPEDICFVNAHGTATRDNDRVEGAVLSSVFGPDIKVLSTKGFTGHTLGAAGGLEAVFTAASLREGWVPATAGFVNRDPNIQLAPVAGRTLIKGHYAVSTSLAFGGNNAALVIGHMQG